MFKWTKKTNMIIGVGIGLLAFNRLLIYLNDRGKDEYYPVFKKGVKTNSLGEVFYKTDTFDYSEDD